MATKKPEKTDKPKLSAEERENEANRRNIDRELDKLEGTIEQLRILFEQHFVDVVPHPPTKMQAEVKREIRKLLKAPFKSSATKFRLRMLVQRYQTYNTYWERIQKLREEGKFSRDLFKAEMREKMLEEAKRNETRLGKAEKGLQQLYTTYEDAIKKAGAQAPKMNFDAFKNSLMKKAKLLKEQHGVKKLNYKIVVKEGKVVIKASAKKE